MVLVPVLVLVLVLVLVVLVLVVVVLWRSFTHVPNALSKATAPSPT